ncbi:MAG TPA: hypothetical protein ENI33_02840 [Thermoplasmatales archaeon]|nr:hypothetical protein [Thermoplasmatales archaeon]
MKYSFAIIFLLSIIFVILSVSADPLPVNPSPPEMELEDIPLLFLYNLTWNAIILISGIILIFGAFKEITPSFKRVSYACILITLSGLIIDYFFVNEQIYWIWVHANKLYPDHLHQFLYDYLSIFVALLFIGLSVFLVSKYLFGCMNKINFSLSSWFVVLNFFIWASIIYLDYSVFIGTLFIYGLIILPFIIIAFLFYSINIEKAKK